MIPSTAFMTQGLLYDRDGRPLGLLADGVSGFATLTNSGQVVAAQAGFKIRVYALSVSALLATAVKLQSNSTDVSFVMSLASTGGFVLPQANAGWFETAVGEALNLNMTVATTVGVQVIYALVR